MKFVWLTFILLTNVILCGSILDDDETETDVIWDEAGYVYYCPCMGRFGNQVDYLLGALGFARGLNRTLVLPPWRTDRMKNTDFDEYFMVWPLRAYHRVILARDFMSHLAPRYWPPGERFGWCYHDGKTEPRTCGMKEGQPFASFWDSLGVNFDDYVYHDIGFDEYFYPSWIKLYDEYPVIALKGAPGRFPVEEKFADLHQYLTWSHDINDEVQRYVHVTFKGEKFIGIHLRNDLDWDRACEHLKTSRPTAYMSSAQCYGYHSNRIIPHNVCWPSKTDIISKLRQVASDNDIHHVFIATDKDPMLSVFKDLIQNVEFHYLDPYRAQIDLAILSRADIFIGNCISSFSSFVSRHRKHMNKTSRYWSVD